MKCIVFVIRVTAPCGSGNNEQMESLVQSMNDCIERQGIEAQLECLPTMVCAVKESTLERNYAFSMI